MGDNAANINSINLSKTQIMVLRQVASGKSSKEIANYLCCSKRTVDYHLYSIYVRLNVSNRIQAVRRAMALGLASAPGVSRAASGNLSLSNS